MDPHVGSTLAHYRLLDRIGEGGMGMVYRALDTRLDRYVAVKILRPELTADPLRRRQFLSEARAAAAVSHPGIATVHEIDETDGVTYIVMELFEGGTLRSLIEAGPLSIAEALAIACQVAGAMARAHAARVIHRDLKPENIVFSADRRAKILDFGLARRLDDGEPPAGGTMDVDEVITREIDSGGRVEGTVAYMSPEQARGEPVDPRTDIFAFGVMLYEMLAGRSPFRARTVTATLAKILESEPEPLARLRPDAPEDLVRIIEKCLRKAREERFEDGAQLASALDEARGGLTSGRVAEAAGASPVSATTIAVFPFSVRGGQDLAYLGAGMVDLLSTKLDGAGDLRSVDPHVILCCSAALAGQPDPTQAARIARRYGAGLFVLGTLLQAGGRLHMEASLYEAEAEPRIVARAALQGEVSGIFDLVDRITAQLVANRSGGPGERLERIGAMTTESFPALKAYLEGESQMRAMRRVEAVEAYRRAVELDTGFALAWYRLGIAALWSGQSETAREAATRAVRTGGRLTERDRGLLEAFDASLRGDNDEAERRYRSIVGSHPDDVEAWYQLGELLFHHSPPRGRPIATSREAWERLVFLDPGHVNGFVHLGVVAASLGDREEVERSIHRVMDLSPTGDLAAGMRAFRAFYFGDATGQEAILVELARASDYTVAFAVQFVGGFLGHHKGALAIARLLLEPVRSAEVRTAGHLFSASLELARGRWSAARAQLDAARALNPVTALEHEALLSCCPLVESPASALETILDHLDRLEPGAPRAGALRSPWIAPHEGLHPRLRLYLMGLAHARLGRFEEVSSLAARLEQMGDLPDSGSLVHDMARCLRSRAAQAEGRLQEALSLLSTTRRQARFDLVTWSPFYSQALERFTMADLMGRLGRREEAIRWYGSFTECSIGDQVHVAPSHLRRAGIYEENGRPREALRHYARFIELWRECDPELRPHVDRAESGMRRLQQGDDKLR
ncbi:MAG TPA: protein kinase [Candidatus Polarisedimenticolia bacterium]